MKVAVKIGDEIYSLFQYEVVKIVFLRKAHDGWDGFREQMTVTLIF